MGVHVVLHTRLLVDLKLSRVDGRSELGVVLSRVLVASVALGVIDMLCREVAADLNIQRRRKMSDENSGGASMRGLTLSSVISNSAVASVRRGQNAVSIHLRSRDER